MAQKTLQKSERNVIEQFDGSYIYQDANGQRHVAFESDAGRAAFAAKAQTTGNRCNRQVLFDHAVSEMLSAMQLKDLPGDIALQLRPQIVEELLQPRQPKTVDLLYWHPSNGQCSIDFSVQAFQKHHQFDALFLQDLLEA